MKENEEQLKQKKDQLEKIKGANYRFKINKENDIKKLEKEIEKSKNEIKNRNDNQRNCG